MTALDVLKSEHQKIRDLIVAVRECATIAEKRDVFDELRDQIEKHTELEETAFYPALEEHEDLVEFAADALEDHQEMLDIIDEVEDTAASADLDEDVEAADDFGDLLDELIDTMERHMEHEETEMVSEIERVLGPDRMRVLADRLIQGREQAGMGRAA